MSIANAIYEFSNIQLQLDIFQILGIIKMFPSAQLQPLHRWLNTFRDLKIKCAASETFHVVLLRTVRGASKIHVLAIMGAVGNLLEKP